MTTQTLPYAAVVLKLLRGVLYFDDKDWDPLLTHQTPVRSHFEGIGLALRIDEGEGYAYLEQPNLEDDGDHEDGGGDGSVERYGGGSSLPRLVNRTRMTYEATLLSVLLREELLNFDAREPDLERLVLSKRQIQEMIEHFFPEQSDMTRVIRKIDSVIGQVVKVGFLRPLKSNGPKGGTAQEDEDDLYEVRRIIKAKISADALVEIRNKLQAHVEPEPVQVEEVV